MRIAIDAMGGDHAPVEIIAGAVEWNKKSDDQVLLVGQEEVIAATLQNFTYSTERIEIVPASQVITMDESPAVAMRRKKDASILVATRLVKQGEADAVLSCGSTGAQMAAALFILGRFENIDRPAIVAAIPKRDGSHALLVDVGANVDCKPQQLLQFALLGKTYAAIGLDINEPRIALLNNGEEEGKGNSLTVEAYSFLKAQTDLNFVGNIEGRDIFSAKADVIVCDGFTGNILLKTIEGLAQEAVQSCLLEIEKIPSFLNKFDYSRVGGAPLLGVEGVSIVCHGSSKREAVYNGIKTARDCVVKDVVNRQKLALNPSL
ncbi:MAG TPA: phosphate acyltransferase PlsX [Syntrophomonas sp.]|nr:phosphate acyltransferase PlsX [Syntrophomonas sp.]HRW11756.1 phosphate acyltransferase PlsX [Syntrophomonas sp.]